MSSRPHDAMSWVPCRPPLTRSRLQPHNTSRDLSLVYARPHPHTVRIWRLQVTSNLSKLACLEMQLRAVHISTKPSSACSWHVSSRPHDEMSPSVQTNPD